jgi:glycine cleavage system H protein
MSESDLLYTKNHCWVRNENGEIVVGITDYAQEQLSDLTFIEFLTGVGDRIDADSEIVTLESVKSVNEVYAPVSGEVLAVNEDLVMQPEVINADPYGKGWLLRIRPDDADDLSSLLDLDAYESLLPAED